MRANGQRRVLYVCVCVGGPSSPVGAIEIIQGGKEGERPVKWAAIIVLYMEIVECRGLYLRFLIMHARKTLLYFWHAWEVHVYAHTGRE